MYSECSGTHEAGQCDQDLTSQYDSPYMTLMVYITPQLFLSLSVTRVCVCVCVCVRVCVCIYMYMGHVE